MTYKSGTVFSDSVNLGSNPSPPATANADVSGVSQLSDGAEKSEIPEQTAHTGRTEVGTAPVRVQRKRTAGWRMPPNTVSVTRPGKWGNPYYPGSGVARGFFDEGMNLCQHNVRDPRVQVKWFAELMDQRRLGNPSEFRAYLAPLRGKNLACWCALDQPCHADVLLKIANQQEGSR